MSKRAKLSDQQLWSLYRRMSQGEHDTVLAEDFCVSRTTISNYRASWGLPQVSLKRGRPRIKPIAEKSVNNAIRFSDSEVEQMRIELAGGASLGEVARKHNTSREYVRLIKGNHIRRGIGINASDTQAITHKRSKQIRLLVIALRRWGFSPSEIAERSGMAYSAIVSLLTGSGTRHFPFRKSRLKREMAKYLYSQGKLQREIAEIMGVSQHTVWVWLNNYKSPQQNLTEDL